MYSETERVALARAFDLLEGELIDRYREDLDMTPFDLEREMAWITELCMKVLDK